MTHEDQGMMCNIAYSAMVSNVLKASITVELLIDILSSMRQHTPSSSDIVCKMSLSILNTRAFMHILNWTLFRRECNVLLKGMGNRNQRNA
jgi:hypothetical protein